MRFFSSSINASFINTKILNFVALIYKVTNTYSCFNFEKNSKYESCKSYELEKCGEHINSQIYGVA